MFQIYTTRAGKDVQEAQGVHKCWPLLISFLLILLFTSRTIYDLVAVKVEDAKQFGFGWTFATDMVRKIGTLSSVISYSGNISQEKIFTKVSTCVLQENFAGFYFRQCGKGRHVHCVIINTQEKICG